MVLRHWLNFRETLYRLPFLCLCVKFLFYLLFEMYSFLKVVSLFATTLQISTLRTLTMKSEEMSVKINFESSQ